MIYMIPHTEWKQPICLFLNASVWLPILVVLDLVDNCASATRMVHHKCIPWQGSLKRTIHLRYEESGALDDQSFTCPNIPEPDNLEYFHKCFRLLMVSRWAISFESQTKLIFDSLMTHNLWVILNDAFKIISFEWNRIYL